MLVWIHVYIFQFADVFHYLVSCQFGRTVGIAIAAHDAGYLKVFGGLKGLERVLADIAVTHYGCSDLLHRVVIFGC